LSLITYSRHTTLDAKTIEHNHISCGMRHRVERGAWYCGKAAIAQNDDATLPCWGASSISSVSNAPLASRSISVRCIDPLLWWNDQINAREVRVGSWASNDEGKLSRQLGRVCLTLVLGAFGRCYGATSPHLRAVRALGVNEHSPTFTSLKRPGPFGVRDQAV